MSDWISCSDRFPEESGEYLVTVRVDEDNSIVLNAWFNKRNVVPLFNYSVGWHLLNEWYDLTNQLRDNIVAWMPYPEPYEE